MSITKKWKLPEVPDKLDTEYDRMSPERQHLKTLNKRECGIDIPADPIDIDAFVEEGVSGEELHKREIIKQANHMTTDSDIDYELQGEPPGIDDDDEIDLGVTPVPSQRPSHRMAPIPYELMHPIPVEHDFIITDNYEDDFDRL